jgi:Holliday junction DNA helicase RuvA
MINFVRGELIEKDPDRLVVLVGGLGLEVRAPAGTIEAAGEVGTQVSVYTYLHVREDALQLYGFESRRARDLFIKLMSVSGFGAAKALSVLSIFPPDRFETVVKMGDADTLTMIPGVGRKGAERLLLEMKDKVEPSVEDVTGLQGGGRGPGAARLLAVGSARCSQGVPLQGGRGTRGRRPSAVRAQTHGLRL